MIDPPLGEPPNLYEPGVGPCRECGAYDRLDDDVALCTDCRRSAGECKVCGDVDYLPDGSVCDVCLNLDAAFADEVRKATANREYEARFLNEGGTA